MSGPRWLFGGVLVAAPLLCGAGAQTERPKVDVSTAFRSVEVPEESRLSGSMFLAVRAAVDFRSARQKARLRASELAVENFVIKVETSDCPPDGGVKGSCLEVSLRPRLSPGEEVMLDKPERRLGRFAAYLVRERDHVVLRAALGREPSRPVP
jgi:hypothetical protein